MRMLFVLAVILAQMSAACPVWAQEAADVQPAAKLKEEVSPTRESGEQIPVIPNNPFAVAPNKPKPTLQELAVISQAEAEEATREAEEAMRRAEIAVRELQSTEKLLEILTEVEDQD